MSHPDLNLLVTLDVLLTEGSVVRAARRLRLSPSAMSRALARLRETTGDPLLVRAGRGLVPTPRALELRERVGWLVQDAEAVLRPVEMLDLKRLVRTFTLRNQDGFVENFGPDLIARVTGGRDGRRRLFGSSGSGACLRPDRQRSRTLYGKPARWNVLFPSAGSPAGNLGLTFVAPAAGCRSGAPLAARLRSRRLRRNNPLDLLKRSGQGERC